MRRNSTSAWGRLGVVLMPLVDLVMLLVLFFALAQGVIQAPQIEVLLPEALMGKDDDRSGPEPVITVTSEGSLYLNGALVSLDVLASELSANDVRMIRLRGDGYSPYQRMKSVLSVLRDEGVPNVRLAVSPEGSRRQVR